MLNVEIIEPKKDKIFNNLKKWLPRGFYERRANAYPPVEEIILKIEGATVNDTIRVYKNDTLYTQYVATSSPITININVKNEHKVTIKVEGDSSGVWSKDFSFRNYLVFIKTMGEVFRDLYRVLFRKELASRIDLPMGTHKIWNEYLGMDEMDFEEVKEEVLWKKQTGGLYFPDLTKSMSDISSALKKLRYSVYYSDEILNLYFLQEFLREVLEVNVYVGFVPYNMIAPMCGSAFFEINLNALSITPLNKYISKLWRWGVSATCPSNIPNIPTTEGTYILIDNIDVSNIYNMNLEWKNLDSEFILPSLFEEEWSEGFLYQKENNIFYSNFFPMLKDDLTDYEFPSLSYNQTPIGKNPMLWNMKGYMHGIDERYRMKGLSYKFYFPITGVKIDSGGNIEYFFPISAEYDEQPYLQQGMGGGIVFIRFDYTTENEWIERRDIILSIINKLAELTMPSPLNITFHIGIDYQYKTDFWNWIGDNKLVWLPGFTDYRRF